MKKVLVVVILIMCVCSVFGNGRTEVDRVSEADVPAELKVPNTISVNKGTATFTSTLGVDITATFDVSKDTPVDHTTLPSYIYRKGSTSYVVQDLYDVISAFDSELSSLDDELKNTYRSFNKDLTKGEMIVYFPVPGNDLNTFLTTIRKVDGLEKIYSTMDYTSPIPVYDFRILNGNSIGVVRSDLPRDRVDTSILDISTEAPLPETSFLETIQVIYGIDVYNPDTTIDGARFGTIHYNLDIFSIPDNGNRTDLEYLLINDRNGYGHDRMTEFSEPINVDLAQRKLRKITSRNTIEAIKAISDSESTRFLNLEELEEQYFLEEWKYIFGNGNNYVEAASTMNGRNSFPYDLYFTSHGVWFPVRMLEEMVVPEIRKVRGTTYQILKWPNDDRTHAGG